MEIHVHVHVVSSIRDTFLGMTCSPWLDDLDEDFRVLESAGGVRASCCSHTLWFRSIWGGGIEDLFEHTHTLALALLGQ